MADNANKEIKTATADDGSTGYEMKIGLGTIAMLISATGMGLVPLFSRWATRTDMFDGALGLNAGDSIGALMAVGRMSMGVLFFVVIMFATGKVETFKKLKLTPAIALGGLMIGMSLACYVTSTLLTTISNAVLFIYIGPVVCVVLARIFRKEPMSALQWVCLVAVFIGMSVSYTHLELKDIPLKQEAESLGSLAKAQASGDLVTLAERGRRVVHLHLPDNSGVTLRQLAEVISDILETMTVPTA